MTTVEEAMSLVRRGFHVFPVKHQGKEPVVRWTERATVDGQTVLSWFAGTEPLNVGIACGPSGLLVVDEDRPGAFGQYATSVGETIPATFTVATGKGQHYYFAANGTAYSNAEGALAGTGIDIRGHGGYVVGPGSVHATGVAYQVTSDVDPAPVPSWLADALTVRTEAASSGMFVDPTPVRSIGLDAWPGPIEVGQRDKAMTSIAGHLARHGLPRSEAEVLMRTAWERCDQPGDDPYPWTAAVEKLQRAWAPAVEYGETSLPGADSMLGQIRQRSELGALTPLTPLVKGVLDYPTAAVLVGGYGVGKTFLVLHLACCVATGRPWLGRPVERRKVLLVIGEGGYGLDKRIAAWEQGYNRGQPVGDGDLVVITQPHSLDQPAVWQHLAEYAVAHGFGFIALDTFSSLAPEADETKRAAFVLAQMSRLAVATNGTVLLAHHPGWGDQERSRGGYQFEANADRVLVMTGTAEEPRILLRVKKIKDGEAGQTIWLNRRRFPLSGNHAGETSVVLEAIDPADGAVPYLDRILAILAAVGDQGATGPQLMKEMGDPNRSAFYKALHRAVEDGDAVRRGSERRAVYYAAEVTR